MITGAANFTALCILIEKYDLYSMPRIKAFDEVEIIEKAKTLFQLKGYEGTSMQDLIETLGISRSSLYDTFGDKHQLYLKTLSAYCTENAHSLVEQAENTKDPLTFIENIFKNIIEQSKRDIEKKGCYVVNAIVEFSERNTDVTEIIEANNKAFEKMLEQLIIKAQQKKQISKNKNPKQIAKFLFSTIYGLRVSAKSNTSIKDLKDISELALVVLK
jgi:TetR/AcrR family transcriptional regulator, transcriptional repressor for nem operon